MDITVNQKLLNRIFGGQVRIHHHSLPVEEKVDAYEALVVEKVRKLIDVVNEIHAFFANLPAQVLVKQVLSNLFFGVIQDCDHHLALHQVLHPISHVIPLGTLETGLEHLIY